MYETNLILTRPTIITIIIRSKSARHDVFLNAVLENRGLMCDNADHPLTIKDTDYLRVVKLAIDASKSKSSDRRGENESDFYLTSTLAVKDIGDYWTQFLYAFPEDRLKRWEVFEKAVKKYYQTLHRTHRRADIILLLCL